MKQLLLTLSILCLLHSAGAQQFNKAYNMDSVFQVKLKLLPEERREEAQKMYKEGNAQAKEFLLIMLTMGISSKKDMINNIDSNLENIKVLKKEYARLVPRGYVVSIEFNPAEPMWTEKESIDISIMHDANGKQDYAKEWRLPYNSAKLKKLITPLNWNDATLKKIKDLLDKAKCVSIENDETTATIGFARSGMGKYSFIVFNEDLSEDQVKLYNDGCGSIFYKNNIVLIYGGGAVGPQCFPD